MGHSAVRVLQTESLSLPGEYDRFVLDGPRPASLRDAFAEFTQVRSRSLGGRSDSQDVTWQDVDRELLRPRSLLVYDWGTTLFAGAPEQVSEGFLDVDDKAPWDTWVAVVTGAERPWLLSWVPAWAQEFIDEAIPAS